MKNRIGTFVLCAILLGSCSTTQQRPSSLEERSDLTVLHFDDNGALENSEQLKQLCTRLSDTPQTTVVFMHGWHGSADPRDNNVRNFTNALSVIRKRSYEATGRKLTGVYLTWHARILPGPLDELAYYFTRARADAIARGQGIANALEALSQAAQRNGRDRFVVAGHSFGGRILGRVVGYRPELLGKIDLYILANTADGADQYEKTLLAVTKSGAPPSRLPKLVWATSAHDNVTGILYPLANGRKPPGFTQDIQDYSVTFIDPDANGHYSADISRVAKRPNRFAHNIVVAEGLGDHPDVWSDPMIELVNFYLFHK